MVVRIRQGGNTYTVQSKALKNTLSPSDSHRGYSSKERKYKKYLAVEANLGGTGAKTEPAMFCDSYATGMKERKALLQKTGINCQERAV